MTVVEWCVSGARILDLLSHKRVEELRNDRSANLSLVETGERKDNDDVRHELCWED